MKQIFILIATTIFSCLCINAQQVFISHGKIEFEKQINLHKQLDQELEEGEYENVWIQNMKKIVPKTMITYYDLYFNEHKTLYKIGKDAPQVAQKIPEWLADDTKENIIFNDIENQKTTSQKTIFSNTFLLQDSLRKINWKITNDSRMIAGIECRKAIGVVMDSVYVIAFYTDIITSSGGPESFTGLPGMILGVAIPRMNTYWFATKVELIQVQESNFTEPKKGKKITYSELEKQVYKATKDWGRDANKYVWKAML